MKSIFQVSLCVALIVATLFTNLSAQTQAPSIKLVVENPTAEADMKVVGDYHNALIGGDLVKAKSLLSAKYMLYGPSAADSNNVEKELAAWSENYKTHLNRKVGFITQSFKVTSGNLQGNWVSLWGTYTCTINGKNIAVPFQSTSRVENGKITRMNIYFDNLSTLTTIGYTLVPPKE